MSDRDILVALLIGGAAGVMGLLDYYAVAIPSIEGGTTFVTVAVVGWAAYKLNR